MLLAKPKPSRAAASQCGLPARARESRAQGMSMSPSMMTRRLRKRPMSQAVGAMESISPRGAASRTLPRAASLICRAALMSGMRTAQEAKTMPMTKKKALMAVR